MRIVGSYDQVNVGAKGQAMARTRYLQLVSVKEVSCIGGLAWKESIL